MGDMCLELLLKSILKRTLFFPFYAKMSNNTADLRRSLIYYRELSPNHVRAQRRRFVQQVNVFMLFRIGLGLCRFPGGQSPKFEWGQGVVLHQRL